MWNETGEGDTRTCWEDGGVPSLCWRPRKAGPGSTGKENGTKQHGRHQGWEEPGENPSPEPRQPHTQCLCVEPVPAASPAGSPAKDGPTQGLEEFQQLQQQIFAVSLSTY